MIKKRSLLIRLLRKTFGIPKFNAEELKQQDLFKKRQTKQELIKINRELESTSNLISFYEKSIKKYKSELGASFDDFSKTNDFLEIKDNYESFSNYYNVLSYLKRGISNLMNNLTSIDTINPILDLLNGLEPIGSENPQESKKIENKLRSIDIGLQKISVDKKDLFTKLLKEYSKVIPPVNIDEKIASIQPEIDLSKLK
jgi:hypothetical protein